MPIRIRPTALLLSAVLAAGSLTGCSAFDLFADCEGTEERVRELESLAILGSRPVGATSPVHYENVDAGCWSDSGDVVVYADRTYAFPGTRAEVLRHYRTAAERDGWHVPPGPAPVPPPGQAESLCFTRAEGGEEVRLDVYFLTAENLAHEEHEPGPELTSGSAYRLSVTSADVCSG
ncbi:hypothetical protein DEJ46_04820 [Streptomyces venezuelae]|uniref:Lipoprotein n=1 Tax=Streptomyces venezuelae TaxID=54571 RepID=A0A5P2AKF9_STRVZ|nr:hypothetical protein DEJ46_04820 [Streptomyces venezuelae]